MLGAVYQEHGVGRDQIHISNYVTDMIGRSVIRALPYQGSHESDLETPSLWKKTFFKLAQPKSENTGLAELKNAGCIFQLYWEVYTFLLFVLLFPYYEWGNACTGRLGKLPLPQTPTPNSGQVRGSQGLLHTLVLHQDSFLQALSSNLSLTFWPDDFPYCVASQYQSFSSFLLCPVWLTALWI